jgi:hypothetical protein
MSKIGAGWAQIGEWFGDICVLLPMALAVIGMLIALGIGILDVTGVGVGLAWMLFYVDIGVLILLLLLAIGGTLFTAGQFVTDMLDNFFANWWTSGIGRAWTSLKSDVTGCGSAFLSGVKKAVAPVVSLIGELKKMFSL